MDNCIFCKIIVDQIPSSRVYQDDRCTAFLDIRPINPGHLLVIPNAHAGSLSALDPATGAQMFRVGQRLAAVLRGGAIPCDGVNLLLSDGEAAGQEVFHVHLHVVPRLHTDNLGLNFGGRHGTLPSKQELEAVAESIRKGIEAV